MTNQEKYQLLFDFVKSLSYSISEDYEAYQVTENARAIIEKLGEVS